MTVSLYTVRVVLNTLGVIDYGIFNVVAGIVTTFSFLSVTLATATQRFFSFELGRQNYEQLKKTFSMTMTIYIMVAIIILLLAETLGLWFLNTKMTIPSGRIDTANWIYQFSILSFMMTMFTIPYDAVIIAYERMNVYAYVSMIEVSLKLLIVYLLLIVPMDKLKLYAILIFGVTTIITLIYRTYCQKKFDECHYSFFWDKKLFKEIAGYSGWNLFGSLAGVFNDQGINMLLNVFFNPVINAARGIAFQISNTINLFVSNFSTAVNPQIIKYYAQNEREKMQILVFQSSKFSYFLLFVLTMPVLLETDLILSLWLKVIPEYVVLFTRLVIIMVLIDSLSGPLITSALATGEIKYYQIIIGGFKLLNLPICFFLLSIGYPPQTTMYVAIVMSFFSLFIRLSLLKKMLYFDVMKYVCDVLLRILLSSLLAYSLALYLQFVLDRTIINLISIVFVSSIFSLVIIYFTGLSKRDRGFLNTIVASKLLKRSKS
ncbi:lipopolysaccharide biosynthesis protein [Flavobacterium crocinum]|nr:lipopolysaccharide biosynthesis protein [Flavobacterium crocinum]